MVLWNKLHWEIPLFDFVRDLRQKSWRHNRATRPKSNLILTLGYLHQGSWNLHQDHPTNNKLIPIVYPFNHLIVLIIHNRRIVITTYVLEPDTLQGTSEDLCSRLFGGPGGPGPFFGLRMMENAFLVMLILGEYSSFSIAISVVLIQRLAASLLVKVLVTVA